MFGNDKVVGRGEAGEKLGQEGGGAALDEIAVDREFGGFFGQ